MNSEQSLERTKISCLNCKQAKRKCDRRLPCCSLCIDKNKPCVYPGEDRRKPATYKYIRILLNRIQTLENSLSYFTSTSLSDKSLQYRSSDYGNLYSGLVASRLLEKKRLETERDLSYFLKTNDNNDVVEKNDLKYFYTLLENEQKFQNHSQKLKSDIISVDLPFLKPSSESPSSSFSVNGYIFPKWELTMSNSGELSFQGPTSLRFIPAKDSCGSIKIIKPVDKVEFFDEFHPEVFNWFFKCIENTFPLVDKQLFFISLDQAIKGNDLGEHSSVALINAIVSFYFLYKGDKDETLHYKKLSINQLNDQSENNNVNITAVQTLILLSHISMIQGREMESAEFIARAVAISSHLGLHVNCNNLVFEGKITRQEAQLRDNVFWCCYFCDRAKVVVLGMSPYMYPIDISIDLPKKPINLFNTGFTEFDVFKEAVIFQDLEFERAYYCFSSDFTFGFNRKPPEKSKIEQELIVSKAFVAINDWKKAMNSNARFKNNNSMVSMQLEIALLSTTLLLNQTLLSETVHFQNIDYENECRSQQISITCFESAKKIIDLCYRYELTENLFLYRFIYSIYISCINFLYNNTSPNVEIRTLSSTYVIRSLELLKRYRVSAPTVDIFVTHLDKFRMKWLEKDVDFAQLFASFNK